jgi:hypothetical protein
VTTKTARAGAAAWTPPFRRSWANWLIERVEALPVPPILVYGTAVAVTIGIDLAVSWGSGGLPVGEFDLSLIIDSLYPAGNLALLHVIVATTRNALQAARPVLGLDQERFRRLEWEMTNVPALAGVLVILVLLPLGPASAIWWRSLQGVAGTTTAVLVWDSLVFIGGYAVFGLLAVNAVRQLRAIGRIGDMARVDILSPEPLSRFADVTARTAMGLALAVVVAAAPRWSTLQNAPAFLTIASGGWIVFAVAVFVLPLQGIHRRLDAEKAVMKEEADRRLKTVIGHIHEAIDRDDLANADALNKMLVSVSHERDLVARLPTWPWSAGTLRGFVTVIIVPIAVFLITRLLDRLLG